jgi:hypothetical protein
LFITDRCPVGCEHCNVDSRAESPTITDWDRYSRIVDWLAARPALELVEITGGEPFIERRGLALACRRLTAAGKLVSVATSGVWATGARVPGWIHDVLARCDCVVLSTDSYHAAQIDDASLINAAREITAAEAWLIVQVLDEDGARDRAGALLNQAFGGRWDQHAEINVVAGRRRGRGVGLFPIGDRLEGRAWGPCALLRTPTVRYDGVVSACANEAVSLGLGPARLRRRGQDANELEAAIAEFDVDPALRVIAEAGFGSLTRHHRLREFAGRCFAENCELCWQALTRLDEDAGEHFDPDPELAAMLDRLDPPEELP